MKPAISVSRRGARIRSSPCSTSGKLVVAPSSTALTVPIAALEPTAANVVSPSRESANGPTWTFSPPRTNGTNTATKSTSGSTTFARDQSTSGPTRAAAATATSASAHTASTGQYRGGVETPTTVIPARPAILARGSSRWTRLAGSPASPDSCSPLTAHHPADAVAGREHDQRAGEAAEQRLVADQRPPGLALARREALVGGDAGEAVRGRRRERRHRGGEPDGERQRHDREPLHAITFTTSGRVDRTALTAATVITASPMPIRTCTPSIAARTVPSGTVPEIASSNEQASAPATTASQAPTPATARNAPRLFGSTRCAS